MRLAGVEATTRRPSSGPCRSLRQLPAIQPARLIARHAKVVVFDLSASSPRISAVSVDPAAPGLADLMLGQASFSQAIIRERLSRVHLVSAGRPGSDRALLQSPRLTLAIDALLRVHDHVLLTPVPPPICLRSC